MRDAFERRSDVLAKENTMKLGRIAAHAILAFGLLATTQVATADELPYKNGSVWSVTFIKVKPGMFNTYIRDLQATRRPLMEAATKDGLVLSEKMLAGSGSNRDDFNMILMVEYKNWAAFDGLDAKFEALGSKLMGSEDKRMQINVKRADMREILGSKNMVEVSYK